VKVFYSDSPDLTPSEGKRVHKTFLFTDIVSSTDIRAAFLREFGDIGNKYYDEIVLLPHDEVLNRVIAEFDGTVVSRLETRTLLPLTALNQL
jgi:hypothetical protein